MSSLPTLHLISPSYSIRLSVPPPLGWARDIQGPRERPLFTFWRITSPSRSLHWRVVASRLVGSRSADGEWRADVADRRGCCRLARRLPSPPIFKSALTHSSSSLQQGLTCSPLYCKSREQGHGRHSRISMDTKKIKKKSSTNHEKKEKRKNERKTWNLEDGVAMQVQVIL